MEGLLVFVGLSGIAIVILLAAKEIIEQMTRRNDLLEAELRANGVSLDKVTGDAALRATDDE